MRGDAIEEDKPLPDEACWFRFITNTSHVTSDRTLHYQALKGSQFSSAAGKSWQHELSGAVVQLAGTADQIRTQGAARIKSIHANLTAKGKPVPSKITFAGIAWSKAEKLRASFDGIQADTAYTPEVNNRAHSDVVTFQSSTDASIDPVRLWLMQTVQIALPSQIEQVVAICR